MFPDNTTVFEYFPSNFKTFLRKIICQRFVSKIVYFQGKKILREFSYCKTIFGMQALIYLYIGYAFNGVNSTEFFFFKQIKIKICHFTTHIPDLGTQITDFGSDYAQHLRNNRQRLSTP